MIRSVNVLRPAGRLTLRPAGRLTAASFAAALVVAGFGSTARADAELPASALIVRNAIVAMSLADAAVPFAVAVSSARDDGPAVMPASSAAMKPETSAAMAAMKPAPTRNADAGLYTSVSYDRRARPYYVPYPLILGIGY